MTCTTNIPGSDPTGVADSTSAIQTVLNSFGAGGGCLDISAGKFYLAENLTVPSNVFIYGGRKLTGTSGSNTTEPYNSLFGTFTLAPTATVAFDGGSGIEGALIYQHGMIFPLTTIAGYAGTAITIGGDDVSVLGCMILGFNQAIYSTGNQREHLHNVYIDCNNGIWLDNSQDIPYVENVHCWPFATIANQSTVSTARPGAGFNFTTNADDAKINNCFSYNYMHGFIIDSCNAARLVGCQSDGDALAITPGSLGFVVVGSSTDTLLLGCGSSARQTGYYVSTTAGLNTELAHCNAWDNTNQGLLVDAGGNVSVSGGGFRNSSYGIYVNNTTSSVIVSNETRCSGNSSGNLVTV